MLSPKLLTLRQHYYTQYPSPTWLFPGRSATRPVSQKTVYRICQHAGKGTKLSKPVYPTCCGMEQRHGAVLCTPGRRRTIPQTT